MLALFCGAGFSVVGCNAWGIGSARRKGRVAGLPSKVSGSHIVGSRGGTEFGGRTSCQGAKLARLFLEVSIVTAPAAAPIFSTLLLSTLPALVGCLVLILELFGFRIRLIPFFKLTRDTKSELSSVL